MTTHEAQWADRRSFIFRLRCSCGWQTRVHMMERDAVAQMRQEHPAGVVR
jgi:hypothetical protein